MKHKWKLINYNKIPLDYMYINCGIYVWDYKTEHLFILYPFGIGHTYFLTCAEKNIKDILE